MYIFSTPKLSNLSCATLSIERRYFPFASFVNASAEDESFSKKIFLTSAPTSKNSWLICGPIQTINLPLALIFFKVFSIMLDASPLQPA